MFNKHCHLKGHKTNIIQKRGVSHLVINKVIIIIIIIAGFDILLNFPVPVK